MRHTFCLSYVDDALHCAERHEGDVSVGLARAYPHRARAVGRTLAVESLSTNSDV